MSSLRKGGWEEGGSFAAEFAVEFAEGGQDDGRFAAGGGVGHLGAGEVADQGLEFEVGEGAVVLDGAAARAFGNQRARPVAGRRAAALGQGVGKVGEDFDGGGGFESKGEGVGKKGPGAEFAQAEAHRAQGREVPQEGRVLRGGQGHGHRRQQALGGYAALGDSRHHAFVEDALVGRSGVENHQAFGGRKDGVGAGAAQNAELGPGRGIAGKGLGRLSPTRALHGSPIVAGDVGKVESGLDGKGGRGRGRWRHGGSGLVLYFLNTKSG